MRPIPFLLALLCIVVCSPVGPDAGPGGPDPGEAPVLSALVPGAADVRIEAGDRVEFQVVATSPRALPLTITFLVDGAPRAVAPEFAFAPGDPGTYAVSAVVSDGQLETVHAWTVTVTAANLPPGVVLAVEPGGGVEPLAARVRVGGDDPDGRVVRHRLEVLGPDPVTLERPAAIDTVLVLAAGHWQATAIVEDDRGATSTASRAIEVVPPNLPPVPALHVAPLSGIAPLDVVVDAGGNDPDGEVVSYRLEIGGELTIESDDPIRRTVRLESPGAFPVVVSVTDDRGATGRDSVVVDVSPRAPDPPPPPPPAGNSPPAVDLLVTPREGAAPLEVTARSVAADADGSVTAVRIDFDGDGAPDAEAAGAEVVASFRYESEGGYTVRATAVDDDGAAGSAVAAVTVRPSNLPPSGSLSLSVTSGDAPLTVLATAEGSDPDGTIAKWEIEASEGDGFLELDGSRSASLVYLFGEAPYRPRLRLTDDRGAIAVVTGPAVTVYRPIGDADASVRGNDAFASTAIAPAVWSDGQDRWRVAVTVRDRAGEPLPGVPLRLVPDRASLSAPDGSPLGPGAVPATGMRTGADGAATGSLTTTLSTRIEAAPVIGFQPFTLAVEADAGHGRWLEVARLGGLNANTPVSATASRVTIRPPNQAVCPGDPIEIEVLARSRPDAPGAGSPVSGRYVVLRYTDGSILPATPGPGYGSWRTDGAGVIRFGYRPVRADQSKLVEAWVDGQPIGQLGVIALEPASECG